MKLGNVVEVTYDVRQWHRGNPTKVRVKVCYPLSLGIPLNLVHNGKP